MVIIFLLNAQAKDLQVEIMDENGNVITDFPERIVRKLN